METAAITVRWTIDNVKEHMEKSSSLSSANFDGGKWHLGFEFPKPDSESPNKEYCALYLYATASSAELSRSGGTWERDMEWTHTLRTKLGRSIGTSWGHQKFVSHAAVQKALALDDADEVVLESTVYSRPSRFEPSIVPQKALNNSLKNLFEDSTTDVVFRIRPSVNGQLFEKCLYAHKGVLEAHSSYFTKLFGSGFSESTRIVSFAELRGQEGAEKGEVEFDDDSREWLVERDDADSEMEDDAIDDSMDDPHVPNGSEAVTASESPNKSPAGAETGAEVELAEAAPDDHDGDTPKSDCQLSVEEQLKARKLREVIVVDAGFATYRALIYWMYTHQLCLTGLHSNYLVYLSSLDLDSNTTSKNSDDMVNTAVSSESTPSRRTWLLNQAETAGTFSTEDRVYPASPHAMYRLADKLDIPDVKEMAKRAILDGFTVENVLYELISTFSYHYAEIQEAALAFCLAHFEEVKLTPAFQRVVAGHARIEGASEILMKLMLKLTVGSAPPAVAASASCSK